MSAPSRESSIAVATARGLSVGSLGQKSRRGPLGARGARELMTIVSWARPMKGGLAAPASATLDCVSTRTLPIVPAGRRMVERSESGASGVVLRASDLSDGWYIAGISRTAHVARAAASWLTTHSRDSLPTGRPITL